MKKCAGCGEVQELAQFGLDRSRKDGRYHTCRSCCRKKYKEHESARRKTNPRLWRSPSLRSKYGIDHDTYEKMHGEQSGMCAICGGPGRTDTGNLSVDHCHETGLIRGLLCQNCNAGIGMFRESPDILGKAIKYLSKWRQA